MGRVQLQFISSSSHSPHTTQNFVLCFGNNNSSRLLGTGQLFSWVVERQLPHSDGPVRTRPGQSPLLGDPEDGIDAARNGVRDRDLPRGLLDAPDVYVRVQRP
jgi:hypothetical protein